MNPEIKNNSTSSLQVCQACKSQFTIEPDDFAFCTELDVPVPDECKWCLWKHLLSFWVFGRFRKAKSALSGKTIITTFSESVRFPLYSHDEWISDAWDPFAYGQDYDPSRLFFEQFAELQAKVPHPHQSGVQNTRCDWSDDVWRSKDCYLSRSVLDCENISYCYRTLNCKNSIDLTYSFDLELCYDCLYCFKCFKTRHAFNSRDCIESAFLYDCRNVQSCFMCWNLRNKSYYILNRPYTKEAYFEKIKEFDLKSRSAVWKYKKEFQEVVAREAIHRQNFNFQVTNSTGNILNECKNCKDCYFLEYSENCHAIFRGFESKDSAYSVGSAVEKGVFSVVDGFVYETLATLHTASCRYSAYLDYCEECEYCFGCVGLRKKKYCILNKQYTKEEYELRIANIKADMKNKGEWGKFFPYKLAYGGYNFSLASVFFPESKKHIEKLGGLWEESEDVAAEDAISDDIPDRIDDVLDDFPTKQLICSKTRRRFNIASHELMFYRQNGIPVPQYHFDVRTLEQLASLAVVIPIKGDCSLCGKSITHFYPPEGHYKKIACVECYQQNVA
ncbi:MAG: hypothetical protein NUV53_02965 [Patescibacteria group bacterium]|nr:hypothetical protein [Patescibacteria group bacterium]